MLEPTDEEIADAVAQNKRVANYRWGTMWVSSRSGYISFAWKAWLFVLGTFFGLLFLLTKLR